MQIFFLIFWWIYFFIFFSGYPLLCLLFYALNKNRHMHQAITEKIFPLLPLTYAFVSTFFWIFMLCTGRMHFVIEKIAIAAPFSLIIAYSFSALLFWLPTFRKKLNLSVIHSLPLFLLPFANMLLKKIKHKVIQHDYILDLLRIYAAGFIIYLVAIALTDLVKWLLSKISFPKHAKNSTSAHRTV